MQRIFKWFTLNDASARVDWFAKAFDAVEFKGEDRLLFYYIKYCSDLGIPAAERYLDAFLRTESKKHIKTDNIKLNDMNNFNYDEPAALEEATRIINQVVISRYQQCMEEDLEGRNFKVDMRTFMTERYKERMIEIMTESFSNLNTGQDAREIGSEMTYQLQLIASNYDVNKLYKLDFLEGRNKDGDTADKDTMRHLFDTNLPCVDGDVGGTFSKQLMAMEGSPGTGKTRLAMIHFAYQCAVVAKKDVLINELELSIGEIRNMLVAHHIINLWNGKVKIPDSLINKDMLTPEQRQYVNAARIDLFESGKYGKFIIDDSKLYVEDLESTMYPLLRRNRNIDYWIIDYAGLAASRPVDKYAPRLQGFEIIQELYKRVKDIIKTADIGALIVNQFNKDGVEAARMGKPIIAGHVEGGQIVERHADYEIAMTATEEQSLANTMMMSTVKVRAAKGFKNVPFNKDLSVSIFRQLKQMQVG